MSQLTMTDLTRVRRHPERAHYDQIGRAHV